MELTKMIIAVLGRLIECYKALVVQSSRDWLAPLRVLFMAVSIVIYVFTSFVILAILLIVIVIALPISAISRTRASGG